MSAPSVTCTLARSFNEKFTNLRKRLDQLGYKQPLSIDCLPLVERLFYDLVCTTESLRTANDELQSQLKLRCQVEEYIAPYKADNGRYVRENNDLHKVLIKTRQEFEEQICSLKSAYRRLENERDDLRMFTSQCLEKLRNYEADMRKMAEELQRVQEKSLQAVVHTAGGQKKHRPFRRQRMDIDRMVPKPNLCKADQYCCAIASLWSETCSIKTPEKLDLVELTNQRCAELEKHIARSEEELELSNRKVENFRSQLSLRDAEIERLRQVLEGGRPLEAVLQETCGRQTDNLIQQLHMQIDLLQSRNEELESRVVDLVSQQTGHLNQQQQAEAEKPKARDVGSQTLADRLAAGERRVRDWASQTVVPWPVDCAQQSRGSVDLIQIRQLLEEILHNRGYSTKRIDALVSRERGLLQKTTTQSKPLQPDRSACHRSRGDAESPSTAVENQLLEDLEADRQHWRSEAELALKALRAVTASSLPSALIGQHKSRTVGRTAGQPELNVEDGKTRRSASLDGVESEQGHLSNTPEQDHESSVTRQLREERDSLLQLLNTFECQLHDIQSNIRVLTGERNQLVEQLSNTQQELLETRDQLVELTSPTGGPSADCHMTTGRSARDLLWQLESQRDETAERLREMTTERDSLRDRLDQLASRELTEKARLLQRLEDTEAELREARGELDRFHRQGYCDPTASGMAVEQVQALTQRLHRMDWERQQLVAQIEEMNSSRHQFISEKQELLATAERNLSTVQSQLDHSQCQYEKLKTETGRLRQTLRQLDEEKDSLQASLDERTERCALLDRELAKREHQVIEYQRSNQTLEQRVSNLSESAGQRDADHRQLREQFARLQTDLQQALSAKEAVTSELKQTKINLSGLSQDNQNMQAQLRGASDERSEFKRHLDELTFEVNRLKELIAYKEQERSEVLKQYRELTVELDEKTGTIGRLEKCLLDCQNTEQVCRQELSTARQHADTLKAEVVRYQQASGTLESQCALLGRVASDSEDRVHRLQTENEELLRELADSRGLCQSLERQVQGSKHKITAAGLEVDQLQAQLIEGERQLTVFRAQVESERETSRNLEKILATSREGEYEAHRELQALRRDLATARECLEAKSRQLTANELELTGLCNQLAARQIPTGAPGNTRQSLGHNGPLPGLPSLSVAAEARADLRSESVRGGSSGKLVENADSRLGSGVPCLLPPEAKWTLPTGGRQSLGLVNLPASPGSLRQKMVATGSPPLRGPIMFNYRPGFLLLDESEEDSGRPLSNRSDLGAATGSGNDSSPSGGESTVNSSIHCLTVAFS